MKRTWIVSDSVVSPLGRSTTANFEQIANGVSGISAINLPKLSDKAFHAARINDWQDEPGLSRFESFCVASIAEATADVRFPFDRSLLILSTTKGNVGFLEEGRADDSGIHLHLSASRLADRFGFAASRVVSNACISGALAILIAHRLLRGGKFDHVLVVGADVLSRFVVSGFQSLQAISEEPCRPFDASRSGISLGECAASVIMSTNPGDLVPKRPLIEVLGGSISNDANHISGPSRTGAELAYAIARALGDAKVSSTSIDFVSAHGTATRYNDEMEAKAFNLAGLADTPVNSMKGYFGHTLGAAGVVETVMSGQSLLRGELIATKGFQDLGVSQPINVIANHVSRPVTTCLKTGSGFGGCNAALVLRKET